MMNRVFQWLKETMDSKNNSNKKDDLITMPSEANKELFTAVASKMGELETKVLETKIKTLEDTLAVLASSIQKITEKLEEQEDILFYIASIVDGSMEEEMREQEDGEFCEECGEIHTKEELEAAMAEDDDELDLEDDNLFQQTPTVSGNKKLNVN